MDEIGEKYISVLERDYYFLVNFFSKYKKIETIITYIRENYVNDISNMDFETGIIHSIFKTLNDRNSMYLTKNGYENYTMHDNLTQEELHSVLIEENCLEEKMIENILCVKICSFRKGIAKTFFGVLEDGNWSERAALIIDLRDNMGGIIEEAIEIAKKIISQSPIAHFYDKERKEYHVCAEENIYNIPIYVLVNHKTGSASELLCAAIKENKRGILIGERTYGKATIQKVVMLQDGSGVKLTIAEFFSPDRNKIDGIGIMPNFSIKDTELTIEKVVECINSGCFDL